MPGSWGTVAKGWLRKRSVDQGADSLDSDVALRVQSDLKGRDTASVSGEHPVPGSKVSLPCWSGSDCKNPAPGVLAGTFH